MEIENWKGIKNESFEFLENETFFEGANGTGKTSMFDALLWTLFGIDHLGRTDHEIRPTVDGEPVHRLESKVKIDLLIDNVKTLTLTRIFKEVWVKPETGLEEVYKNNTTAYYINDLSVRKKDYDAMVTSICSAEGFKMVTNPYYFNSLHWEERRKMLFDIAGDVTDEYVAKGNREFEELIKEVTGVGFVNFKKALAVKKKKLQDELDDIDPRISELIRSRPEVLDWEALLKKLESNESELKDIEKQLEDVAKKSEAENKSRLLIQEEINALEQENHKLKLDDVNKKNEAIDRINQKIRYKLMEKGNMERDGKTKKARLDFLNGENKKLQEKRSKLLEEYRVINAEQLVFKEGEFICPTCNRELDDLDIMERQQHMTEEFNRSKTERIEKNVREGKALKAQIEEVEKEIAEIGEIVFADVSAIDAEIEKLNKELSEAKAKLLVNAECEKTKENEGKIAVLRAQLAQGGTSTTPDRELQSKKEALNGEIKEIIASLATREMIENSEKRKKDLEKQKKALNQGIADIEAKEYLVKNFEYAKSEAVENKVNGVFEIVKFKLFRTLVDGQVVPRCECMIDGVLYSTLNSAAQMMAGLDIIRVLNRHFDLYAPIFLDNREGVTEIPEMDCQIINLVVNPARKKLKKVSREETIVFR